MPLHKQVQNQKTGIPFRRGCDPLVFIETRTPGASRRVAMIVRPTRTRIARTYASPRASAEEARRLTTYSGNASFSSRRCCCHPFVARYSSSPRRVGVLCTLSCRVIFSRVVIVASPSCIVASPSPSPPPRRRLPRSSRRRWFIRVVRRYRLWVGGGVGGVTKSRVETPVKTKFRTKVLSRNCGRSPLGRPAVNFSSKLDVGRMHALRARIDCGGGRRSNQITSRNAGKD